MTNNKQDEAPMVQAIQEIRTGGLSVLSDRAQDKIIDLLQWVAQDAYERGVRMAQLAAKKSQRERR